MKETNFMKLFLPYWQEKNGKDSHLFRNNTGSAYQGEIENLGNKIIINSPRFITYGIGLLRKIKGKLKPVGGGDLIGWTTKTVCDVIPEVLVPSVKGCCSKECSECRIAVFTSIELKTKDVNETKYQKEWKKLVKDSGGIAETIKENKNEY